MNDSDLEFGFMLHNKGELVQARSIYEKFIRKNPRHFQAIYSLGVLHAQQGRFQVAAELFGKATRLKPDSVHAHYNRGVALNMLAAHEPALESYRAVLRLDPFHADAMKNRVASLLKLKRFQEALDISDRLPEAIANSSDALDMRGLALRELKRLDEALDCHDRAFRSEPGHLGNLVNRGIALRELNRLEEALSNYDRALAIDPQNADAHYNKGVALQKMNRLEEAIENYDQAIRITGNFTESWSSRGTALAELGRFDDAIANYDRAIELEPGYADAHSNKSLSLLLLGKFDSGWEAHEWRKRTYKKIGARRYPQPEWTGAQDLAGKTLFIHWEQGLGDTIQFCRYAKLAQARGARVIVSVQDGLVRLLKDLSPAVEIIDSKSTPTHFDYHVALLSLPLAFKTGGGDIPADVCYLRAEPDRRETWKQKLGGHGFKIGIAWRGSQLGAELGKSFSIACLQGIAKLPTVRLISLQKHEGSEELAGLPEGMSVETLGEDFDCGPHAFLDTAAVMENLDLVITTDTSIAHMAGALGRPTWVALKHVPDWRWLLDRDDSPWYPTLRLFRQQRRDDWTSVFAAMERELAGKVDAQQRMEA